MLIVINSPVSILVVGILNTGQKPVEESAIKMKTNSGNYRNVSLTS